MEAEVKLAHTPGNGLDCQSNVPSRIDQMLWSIYKGIGRPWLVALDLEMLK